MINWAFTIFLTAKILNSKLKVSFCNLKTKTKPRRNSFVFNKSSSIKCSERSFASFCFLPQTRNINFNFQIAGSCFPLLMLSKKKVNYCLILRNYCSFFIFGNFSRTRTVLSNFDIRSWWDFKLHFSSFQVPPSRMIPRKSSFKSLIHNSIKKIISLITL